MTSPSEIAVDAAVESPLPLTATTYLSELRHNARPLAAASLGVAVSLPLLGYTNSVFAPFLLAEFGWSRAQFAVIGMAVLASLVFLPITGRLTDRLGVRRMATAGTLLMPMCFIGFSAMNGDFRIFLALNTLVLVFGAMTSQLVYTRLIAEAFARAQGLALTLVNCAPAVLAIALVPVMNLIIEILGWRIAYLILGAFCLVVGLAALALIPPTSRPIDQARSVATQARRSAMADFRIIGGAPVFWTIMSAMFLCLLQNPLHSSQMSLMLIDQHLSPASAATVVSIYAFGTIVGRFACGLALDRYSTRVVTFISMTLPAAGFLVLATPFDVQWAVNASMFLVGLSVGAESDLISFLIAKYFKIHIYSSTLSLVFCCSYLASASGSLILSRLLSAQDSFGPFLYLVAAATIIGGTIFLLLPQSKGFEKIG
jgi:MFS family permease